MIVINWPQILNDIISSWKCWALRLYSKVYCPLNNYQSQHSKMVLDRSKKVSLIVWKHQCAPQKEIHGEMFYWSRLVTLWWVNGFELRTLVTQSQSQWTVRDVQSFIGFELMTFPDSGNFVVIPKSSPGRGGLNRRCLYNENGCLWYEIRLFQVK